MSCNSAKNNFSNIFSSAVPFRVFFLVLKTWFIMSLLSGARWWVFSACYFVHQKKKTSRNFTWLIKSPKAHLGLEELVNWGCIWTIHVHLLQSEAVAVMVSIGRQLCFARDSEMVNSLTNLIKNRLSTLNLVHAKFFISWWARFLAFKLIERKC